MANTRVVRLCLRSAFGLNTAHTNHRKLITPSTPHRPYSTSTEPPLTVPQTDSHHSSDTRSLPVLISRPLTHLNNINPSVTPIREVWMESLVANEPTKLAIVQLHPSVFGAFPRVDLIYENHKWQTMYKKVDWLWLPSKMELPGSGAKPWPQKGTGRARAHSRRAPQWKGGGWCHGPRGPRTYFYMLPFPKRVKGLVSMLSAKLAQDDLRVVDTLDGLPSDDPMFIQELCEYRRWGPSVLFVDKSDLFPRNIALATNEIKHINLMPVYGLNVYSMLKHETLVLTMAAVEELEAKLLFQLTRTDLWRVMAKWNYNRKQSVRETQRRVSTL